MRHLHEHQVQAALQALTPPQLQALENFSSIRAGDAGRSYLMLFNLGSTLRSLTAASPITTALEKSRRQARRWLEHGGSCVRA